MIKTVKRFAVQCFLVLFFTSSTFLFLLTTSMFQSSDARTTEIPHFCAVCRRALTKTWRALQLMRCGALHLHLDLQYKQQLHFQWRCKCVSSICCSWKCYASHLHHLSSLQALSQVLALQRVVALQRHVVPQVPQRVLSASCSLLL